jgi:death-on-curing protein
MIKEPIWIREDAVLAIHHRQIAEHGGASGVRDAGLLSSALRKPQNKYVYSNQKPDIAGLSASYAYGISQNHPFMDGNKRTAFVVCRLFLKLNGADILATGGEKFQTFMKLASGEMSEEELADWIRGHLV